jgi:hypothetical protein
MSEVDWNAAEMALYDRTQATLRVFAKEHDRDVFSFFAYRADYCYGQVQLCLDTVENSRRRAVENNQRIHASRKKLFDREGGWDRARYFLSRHSGRMLDYTHATGLFQYDSIEEIRFPDWEAYFRGDHYDEQYQLENRVIVLFWKILSRLVQDGVFDQLRLASPFRTGFEFRDNDLGLVVMDILNCQ